MANTKAAFELLKKVNISAEKNFKNIHRSMKVNYRAEAERILGKGSINLSNTRAIHGENLSHASNVMRKGRLDNNLQDILNGASNNSKTIEGVFKQEWKGPGWSGPSNKPSKYSKSDRKHKSKMKKYNNEKKVIDHNLNDRNFGELKDPHRRFKKWNGRSRKVSSDNMIRNDVHNNSSSKENSKANHSWFDRAGDQLNKWGKQAADYYWNDATPAERFKRIGLTAGGWMGANTTLRYMNGGDMLHNPDGENDLAGIPLF